MIGRTARVLKHGLTWLRNAALLWDRIYRIVPDGYKPRDSDGEKALFDEGEIGIPLSPRSFAEATSDAFLERVGSREWNAAALSFAPNPAYARLHFEKVDARLRAMLLSAGDAEDQGQWLRVPREFAAAYMTYLAGAIANKNGLALVADDTAAWSGATYFRYDGEIEPFPRADLSHQLATLILRDVVPSDHGDIGVKALIGFRMKYRDERRRFMASIRKAVADLAGCKDPTIVKDQMEDVRRDVEAALRDYRASLRAMKFKGLAGIVSMAFPGATDVLTKLAGAELSPERLFGLSATGVALGVVSGLSAWEERKKAVERGQHLSYLLELERKWKRCAMYDNDYSYRLCRSVEEFIND